MATSVLIADRERLVRRGLRFVLGADSELQVVGEAASTTGASALLSLRRPGLAILEARAPGLDGIRVMRTARGRGIATRFLVFSQRGEAALATEALRAGALGVLHKSASPEEIRAAVSAMRAGVPWLGSLFAAGLRRADPGRRTLARLARALVSPPDPALRELASEYRRLQARSRREEGAHGAPLARA